MIDNTHLLKLYHEFGELSIDYRMIFWFFIFLTKIYDKNIALRTKSVLLTKIKAKIDRKKLINSLYLAIVFWKEICYNEKWIWLFLK